MRGIVAKGMGGKRGGFGQELGEKLKCSSHRKVTVNRVLNQNAKRNKEGKRESEKGEQKGHSGADIGNGQMLPRFHPTKETCPASEVKVEPNISKTKPHERRVRGTWG